MMTRADTVIVKDQDGNVIAEGFVTSMSMDIDQNYNSIRYKIEAAGLSRKDKKPAGTFEFRDSPLCEHDWADYNGLQESFQFCKTCGEKK